MCWKIYGLKSVGISGRCHAEIYGIFGVLYNACMWQSLGCGQILCMQRRICVRCFFNKMAVVTVRDPFHNKVTFLSSTSTHTTVPCVHTFRTWRHTYAYEHTRHEGERVKEASILCTHTILDIPSTFCISNAHTHTPAHTSTDTKWT